MHDVMRKCNKKLENGERLADGFQRAALRSNLIPIAALKKARK